MSIISPVEKGTFLKLFNRGGYVLNLSTNDFDIFTLESIGLALCEHYGLSKGKSLSAYVREADEDKVIKLFNDLLTYYEIHFLNEIENNEEYSVYFRKCKSVMGRAFSKSTSYVPSAEELKIKFSSEYISAQIDLMINMQKENPTEAIGKAKELLESCCKTILEDQGIVPDKNWNINRLTDETMKTLKITPHDIPDSAPEAIAIKGILGNLRTIASNLATIRNTYGSGHGKSSSYKGLEERHAKLAVGSSITLVNYLWDSRERREMS